MNQYFDSNYCGVSSNYFFGAQMGSIINTKIET